MYLNFLLLDLPKCRKSEEGHAPLTHFSAERKTGMDVQIFDRIKIKSAASLEFSILFSVETSFSLLAVAAKQREEIYSIRCFLILNSKLTLASILTIKQFNVYSNVYNISMHAQKRWKTLVKPHADQFWLH